MYNQKLVSKYLIRAKIDATISYPKNSGTAKLSIKFAAIILPCGLSIKTPLACSRRVILSGPTDELSLKKLSNKIT